MLPQQNSEPLLIVIDVDDAVDSSCQTRDACAGQFQNLVSVEELQKCIDFALIAGADPHSPGP